MLNPPQKQLINPDDLFGSREIRFHDRRESHHPQLMRLCADFNFSVLQVQRKVFSHLTRKLVPGAFEFFLALRDETSGYWFSVSPAAENLALLNDYCKTHEIDLLHMHLFGDDEAAVELPGDAFY